MHIVPTWCKRHWLLATVLSWVLVMTPVGMTANASYRLDWADGIHPYKGAPALVEVIGLRTQPPLPGEPLVASGTASRVPTVRILEPTGNSCQASYYSGARGASGSALTGMFAAHKSAPFHSHWRVSGPKGSVVVQVLDRGPFIAGRCWDLAPAAFSQIATLRQGVARVTYTRVD